VTLPLRALIGFDVAGNIPAGATDQLSVSSQRSFSTKDYSADLSYRPQLRIYYFLVLGDAINGGFVDIFDVNLVSANWDPAGPAGPTGDANGDMKVDWPCPSLRRS
jgi:hypothetical protein